MIVPIAFALLASVGNLFGGGIVVARRARGHGALHLFTAFGAGFMLAVALLEMLPAALEVSGGLTALVLGYLAVHLTQHTMTPHFHFGEETHGEAMISRGVGVWALVGLLPHSFFDGVAIGSGFLADAQLGLLIFAAVFMHKVPAGVSLASIMMASGNSARNAMTAVASIGLATVIGAAVTPAFDTLVHYGLAIAAGVTLYVAASNLIPESQRESGWQVPGSVFLGVGAFYVARLLLPGA